LEKNICKLLKANKSPNNKLKEQSMKLIKLNKLRNQPLLKLKHQPNLFNWLEKLQSIIHVNILTYLAYLDVRKIEYAEKIANVLSESKNHVLLNNNILSMELPAERDFSKIPNLNKANK